MFSCRKKQQCGNVTSHALSKATLALIIAALLSSCSGATRNEASDSYAISFTAPGFYLAPGMTLAWRSELVYLFDGVSKIPEDFEPLVQPEIEAYFQEKGYSFSDDINDVDFGIIAVVVLGEGLTAADVLKQYGLTPSFNASRQYEKGTLVIAFYRRAEETIVWRGAIQSNIDPLLPAGERKKEIRLNVARLLKKLPTAPPH